VLFRSRSAVREAVITKRSEPPLLSFEFADYDKVTDEEISARPFFERVDYTNASDEKEPFCLSLISSLDSRSSLTWYRRIFTRILESKAVYQFKNSYAGQRV